MNATDGPAPSDALTGWKEVADYVGRSVRTVQRYERELGLPIHRVSSEDGGSVYALRKEIDSWLRTVDAKAESATASGNGDDSGDGLPPGPAQSELPILVALSTETIETGPAASGQTVELEAARPTRTRHVVTWLTAAALVGLGAVLALTVAGLRRDTQTPALLRLAGQTLTAFDSDSHVLWTYSFGKDVRHPNGNIGVEMVDLDGDGEVEILVPVRFATIGGARPTESDGLFCFSRAGKLLWAVKPTQTLSCGQQSFEPPWQMDAVAVSPAGVQRRVWASFTHNTWWPSFVLEITSRGQPSLRYLQTGWVTSLAYWATPAGDLLAAGGVTNDQARPSLALLDITGPAVRMPSTNPRFSCEGSPTEPPRKIFLIPNNEMALATRASYAMVGNLRVVGHDLKATLTDDGGDAILLIGEDGRVKDFSFGDAFWAEHREYEALGRLTHSAELCPERKAVQDIRSWTLTEGWRDNPVAPTVRISRSPDEK